MSVRKDSEAMTHSSSNEHEKEDDRRASDDVMDRDDQNAKEEQDVSKDAPPVNPWDPSQFPDGGFKAWSVVAGGFCSLFCSFGWINCIGIFQEYYQSQYLRGYSSSTISWIASLELFILFAGGLVVGRVYDRYGPRHILLFGTFMHVFGLMMASLSTEYYQILLSQGICSPIGISCLFTPAVNCIATWFRRRRGLANGIVAAGSSLGGVIFPIMFNRLIPEVGFPWAMRIGAFLILFLLIIANLTVVSRIPPMPKPIKPAQYLAPFQERTYLLTTIAAMIFVLGLFLPINYIQAQAVEFGMDPSLANYLIPILNAASLFGRTVPGFVADKVGAYNVHTFMCFFSSVVAFALWLPAAANAPIIVFAALYGFGSGAFVAILPTLIAQISDIKEIGLRIGMEFGVLSIPALVSNPIGGAFVAHDNGGYRSCQIWTGCITMLGAILFVVARISLGGPSLMKKV